ncbi:DMT family transporter [bacterium]|nr:DMT family transporter [bacterium]
MFVSVAVLIRIISNSLSNVYQKQLAQDGFNPSFINFVMYTGLTLLMLPVTCQINFINLSFVCWGAAILGGLFGALGNSYLVKALKNGELSVLGPINAYKSVVAMIIGIFLLKEIPSAYGIMAIFLIIAGSYFVFDTQEEGFSFKLLKRADIRYRIYALIFTAIEAVFIKEVINNSDIVTSFILWSFFGMLFTGIIVLKSGGIKSISPKTVWLKLLVIILLMGVMQFSTNYVFSHIQVSYGLAFFQLSALLSVIFGWKYFNEAHILKKLIGTVVMITGAVLLILA